MFLVFGLVFGAAGIISGTSGTSAYGYGCGSFFSPVPHTGSSVSAIMVELGCEDVLAGRGWMTWIALAVGVALLVAGVILLSRPPRPSSGNVTGDLVELDRLRASGVLSDEEFSAAKARVLGTPSGRRVVSSAARAAEPDAVTGETRRSRRDG